jgi:hypothetical protein
MNRDDRGAIYGHSVASSWGEKAGFDYNYLKSLGYKYSIIYLMRIEDTVCP